MFRRAVKLPFKLLGIPLYLDWSFLIVLPLMTWLTARNLAVLIRHPQLGLDLDPAAFEGMAPLLLGLVAVLGLFTCIVLHELGHSITARWYGVKVRRITLWFLGGMAEFDEMPRQRGAEAIVAIAGPIVSFVLAGLFWGLTFLVPQSSPAAWIVIWYLWVVNLMLGLFNLLPAMPMDGGRVLRSVLALGMTHVRATMIAGNVARVIAVLLGLWGLVSLNLWTVVLAYFIFSAAGRETDHSVVVENLKGLEVATIMNRDVRTVPAWMNVGRLGAYMIAHRHTSFPVVDDTGRLIGTIGTGEIERADPYAPVWSLMNTRIVGISQHATAIDAMRRMELMEKDALVVFDDAENMIGILSRSDLLRAIGVRMLGLPLTEDPDGPSLAASAMSQRRPDAFASCRPPGYTAPEPFPYSNKDRNAAGNPERHARPL